jgi:4-hydroxy-3-methylbut-2-enyl diphosphate reductase
VELCELKLPTYFINDEHCLISAEEIRHFDMHTHTEKISSFYLPSQKIIKAMITSGASCPDALVDRVIERLAVVTGNENALAVIKESWEVS